MNKVGLGQFIVQLRKEKGMTQVELAKELNISNKTISKWETGRGLPDVSMLEPLSKALGISVVELLNQKQLENKQNYTLEYVSQEVIKGLEYSHKRHTESLKDSLISTFILCLGAFIYFIVFLILSLVSSHFYIISILIGLLLLIKGIWNIQTGKTYALILTFSILSISIPLLLPLLLS